MHKCPLVLPWSSHPVAKCLHHWADLLVCCSDCWPLFSVGATAAVIGRFRSAFVARCNPRPQIPNSPNTVVVVDEATNPHHQTRHSMLWFTALQLVLDQSIWACSFFVSSAVPSWHRDVCGGRLAACDVWVTIFPCVCVCSAGISDLFAFCLPLLTAKPKIL